MKDTLADALELLTYIVAAGIGIAFSGFLLVTVFEFTSWLYR